MSETLGFVFIFALIVSTTGLVYTLGTSNLQDVRDAERLNNAERAFDVMAENMNDLQRRSVNSRSTEIKLSEAQIFHGEEVRFTITGVLNETGEPPDPSVNFSGTSQSLSYEITPIVYRGVPTEETRLVYVNGAVIRDQRDGVVMVREPAYRLSKQAFVLPVLVTRPLDERNTIGGSTTVLVRGTSGYSNRELLTVDTRRYDVTINVTSPRANAWRRYFRSKPAVTCPTTVPQNDTFASCEFTTNRVYLSRINVNVEFE